MHEDTLESEARRRRYMLEPTVYELRRMIRIPDVFSSNPNEARIFISTQECPFIEDI
jgi:hypothetical protein